MSRIPTSVRWVCVYLTWCACSGAQQGVTGNPVAANTQQTLQAVLYSIEERLRGLDLIYAPRYAPPRHWDTEQYTRRLDAIEASNRRIEALLELRLDKMTETISSNQMKQSLSNDHVTRKIDSLYERLNHRMGYTENRLDLDVAKIQASMESGFARIARSERDSENFIEVDLETQIQEMQRQFDTFETNQNTTLSTLIEMSNKSCKNSELNDAGNVEERDFDKKDIDQFAQSMENVATKVNKMVTDFSLRTQVMESLVKNSMSLSNATRRELQDGLRSLGLRMIHQTKHSKDKESFFEFGSDALATLIRKEFENLGVQLQSNQDKLVAAQDGFRHSCHRLQETEQQLSATVAQVLDGMLDLIRNRSTDMTKQMATFQEILKHHNSQMLSTVNRTTHMSHATQQIEGLPMETVAGSGQAWEKLQDGIINVLAGIQVIQDQISEMTTVHPGFDDIKESCPDSTAIADKILDTITSKQIDISGTQANIDTVSGLIDKLLATIKDEQKNAEIKATGDNLILHLETNLEDAADNKQHGKHETENGIDNDQRRVSHILDIIEEDLGDTLHYNVTQDETLTTDNVHRTDVNDNITEEIDDYEHSSSEVDKTEHLNEDEGESNSNEEQSHLAISNGSLKGTVKLNLSKDMSRLDNTNKINSKGPTSLRNNQNEEFEDSEENSKILATILPTGKMITPHLMELIAPEGLVNSTDENETPFRLKSTREEQHSEEISIPRTTDIDFTHTQNKTELVLKTKLDSNTEDIRHSNFSRLWHKVKNSTINNSTDGNAKDLSISGVELVKGHNVNVIAMLKVGDDSKEVLQKTAEGTNKMDDDMITSGNQELRFLDQTQIHDNDEYDYDK